MMGYYTNYTLTWKATRSATSEWKQCDHVVPQGAKFCPECGKQVASVFLDDRIAGYIKGNDNMAYALDENGETAQSTKWYEHEEDMRAMSNSFPGVVFTLHGEGEENGDIWNRYFLNGKCQVEKAKIVIADFDEKKLR